MDPGGRFYVRFPSGSSQVSGSVWEVGDGTGDGEEEVDPGYCP